VIFLGEFSHCGYKENLKKLGKFVHNSVNLRKKCSINGKNLQSLQTTKLKKNKKMKEKTLIIFVYQVQILALIKPSSILVPSYRGFGFASNN